MKKLKRLMASETGSAAAEYALILAIIGGAVTISAVILGSSIAGSMNKQSNCMTSPTKANC